MEQKQTATEVGAKKCPVFELFNFLQDLRHIILIDLRETNQESPFIRNSLNLKQNGSIKDFIGYVNVADKKGEQFESKYNSKKIRRAVFYDEGEISSEQESAKNIKKYIDILKQQDKDYRVYYLKGGFAEFQKKYPFLCLNQEQIAQYSEMNQVSKDNEKITREGLLTDIQKQVLFSFSQFPIEFYENLVYLGNIHHANSDHYLKALNIKTVIDFCDKHSPEFEKRIEDTLKKNYTYWQVPLEKNKTESKIDFNEFNSFIETQIEEGKGPILIFCKDGNSISPIFAIAFLMYIKGLQFQIASLKVFQYKGGVIDVCNKIYTQLMQYSPPPGSKRDLKLNDVD